MSWIGNEANSLKLGSRKRLGSRLFPAQMTGRSKPHTAGFDHQKANTRFRNATLQVVQAGSSNEAILSQMDVT